jgi:hypothetical protein
MEVERVPFFDSGLMPFKPFNNQSYRSRSLASMDATICRIPVSFSKI